MSLQRYNKTTLFSAIEDGTHPIFNIKIKFPRKGSEQFKRSALAGPGIYAIFHHKKLVYIGKHESSHELVSKRWDKHIKSFTMRGVGLAFISQALSDKVQKNATDEDFKQYLVKYSPIIGVNGVKDGSQISAKRAAYADKYWSEFSKKTIDNIFDDFEFHYVRLSKRGGIKLNAKAELRDVETALIDKHQPEINGTIASNNKPAHLSMEQYISNMRSIFDSKQFQHIRIADYTIFE